MTASMVTAAHLQFCARLALLGRVRRNRIHQSRAQHVVCLQSLFPELLSDTVHLCRVKSLLNDTAHECCELRFLPSTLVAQLGVHKVWTELVWAHQTGTGAPAVWCLPSPLKGWSVTMRPNRCTPHSLHAFRWIAALESTMYNFCPFAVTESLSVGMTPTTEKSAFLGFQHFEQPQAWLCSTLLPRLTSTFLDEQWQNSFPPVKFVSPFLIPLSMEGCRESAIVVKVRRYVMTFCGSLVDMGAGEAQTSTW